MKYISLLVISWGATSNDYTEKCPRRNRCELRRKNAALDQLIRPLPNPRYTIDVSFRYIEHQLNGYEQDWGGLNLEPSFQRGHVWTHRQRVAFIEDLPGHGGG